MTRVAIVGGGLAGLAAAVTLAGGPDARRWEVELFEARRRLGGRAGSFRDPQSGEWIDHCQHVAMGCCTQLADLCRRTGIAGCFARHRRLHFIARDGIQHGFAAAAWLPAPLHLLPGLFGLRYLSVGERLGIVRAMARLAWQRPDSSLEQDQTIGEWLRRAGQSARAIEEFWSVVLVSALGETLDRASLAAARQVFVEGFLRTRRAWELYLPQVPLGEIFDRRLGAWLAARQVAVRVGTRVQGIEGDARRAAAVVLADGTRCPVDYVIVAVPWRQVRGLFSPPMLAALGGLEAVDRIESAPIAAVHLWFDRPLTLLPHAVLVGRLGQWLFPKVSGTFSNGAEKVPDTFLYQVVISAARGLRGRDREQLVRQLRGELTAIWPAAGQARLLRWRMVVEPEAVFSVRPGLDRFRPAQATPIPNLMLAGDWTATGWPATMEGAVRSGYQAAEAVRRTTRTQPGCPPYDAPLT